MYVYVRDTRALVAAACATKGTELPSLLYIVYEEEEIFISFRRPGRRNERTSARGGRVAPWLAIRYSAWHRGLLYVITVACYTLFWHSTDVFFAHVVLGPTRKGYLISLCCDCTHTPFLKRRVLDVSVMI